MDSITDLEDQVKVLLKRSVIVMLQTSTMQREDYLYQMKRVVDSSMEALEALEIIHEETKKIKTHEDHKERMRRFRTGREVSRRMDEEDEVQGDPPTQVPPQ